MLHFDVIKYLRPIVTFSLQLNWLTQNIFFVPPKASTALKQPMRARQFLSRDLNGPIAAASGMSKTVRLCTSSKDYVARAF